MLSKINWKEASIIRLKIENETAVLSCNREGLLSLADHLIALAEEDKGSHIHYDKYNSLEDDSNELIIEKI